MRFSPSTTGSVNPAPIRPRFTTPRLRSSSSAPKAAEFDLDPDRIGLIGDSAGAHLAALVALAGDQYALAYRDDANAAVPVNVKCMVGFYGVYDMYAQWTRDLTARPNDKIVEKFLGVSPMQNRRVYFDASPISYATMDHNQIRFLLIHGTDDDIVDPETQSEAFLSALAQAELSCAGSSFPAPGISGRPIHSKAIRTAIARRRFRD